MVKLTKGPQSLTPMIGDEPATVIDSFNWPTCTTTLVRTTWLVATSTPGPVM